MLILVNWSCYWFTRPPKCSLFSLYIYIYSSCPTSYKYALSLVGLWACKFRAIFPTFYSKNCLQKLENKPAIYRPLSRSHQSKKIDKKIHVFEEIDNYKYLNYKAIHPLFNSFNLKKYLIIALQKLVYNK